MASNISRRLSSLENKDHYVSQAFIWREVGQTHEQAVAERFPEGVPPGVEAMVIGWQEPDGELARASIAGLKPQDGGEYGLREPLR